MDQAQFSDHLMALEGLHLTKLTIWGGLSVLTATLILALLRRRRLESPLLQQFAYQALAWGLFDVLVAMIRRNGLALRDLTGATQLDRFVFFSIGVEVGVMLVGLTLIIAGWRLARLALVGAGIGTVVQGLALALLHGQLSAGILR